MSEAIIIQSPTVPVRMALLFHGVSSTPESLIPLGRRIAATMPRSIVISVPSAESCDVGSGFQWFSVRGVTEDNRVQRVADGMPRFLTTIKQFQTDYGMKPGQTDLIGFSQVAIVAVESSQVNDSPTRTVISLAGRFARLPERASGSTRFHFIHGATDPVISPNHSLVGFSKLSELGAHCTVDLIPSLAPAINEDMIEKLIFHLDDVNKNLIQN